MDAHFFANAEATAYAALQQAAMQQAAMQQAAMQQAAGGKRKTMILNYRLKQDSPLQE